MLIKKPPPKHVVDGTRALLDHVRAKRVTLSREEFIDLIANAGRCFSSSEAKNALALMKESMPPCAISHHRVLRALTRESKHDEAITFFKSLDQVDSELFAEAITSCGYNGDLDTARELLASMQQSGLKPTEKIYCGLIRACRKTLDIDAAQGFWRDMVDAGIVPNRGIFKALMLVYRDAAVAERNKVRRNPPPFTANSLNSIIDGLRRVPSTDTVEEFPIESLVDQAELHHNISLSGDMGQIVLDALPLVHYERWLKKIQKYSIAKDPTLYTYALEKLVASGQEKLFWSVISYANGVLDGYVAPSTLTEEAKDRVLLRRRRQKSLLDYDIHRDRWTTSTATFWLHSLRRSRVSYATVLAHAAFIVNTMVTSAMPTVDAKTLNALMATLYRNGRNVEDGHYAMILSLFDAMQRRDIVNNESIFFALNCCRHLKLADRAIELINTTSQSTVAMYNIAIDTCVLAGEFDKAFKLYHQMPMRPTSFTFARLFKACSKRNDTQTALELLETMEESHIGAADPNGLAALITTFYHDPCEIMPLLQRIPGSSKYAQMYDEALHIYQVHGMWREATELLTLYGTFNVPKTTTTHVKYLLTCANGENYNLAMEYLYSLDEASTQVINAAIRVCGDAKKSEEALELFNSMQTYGLNPDELTYLRLFHAIARNGGIDQLQAMLPKVPKEYVSIRLYNRMLGACVFGERPDKALELFNQMVNEGIAPDIITINTVLRSMKKSRSFKFTLEVMKDFFERATVEHKIVPDAISYIQLLQKARRTKQTDQCMAIFAEMEKVWSPRNDSMKILIQAYAEEMEADASSTLDDLLEIFHRWIDSFDDPEVYVAMLQLLANDKTTTRDAEAHSLLRHMEEHKVHSKYACVIVMKIFNQVKRYRDTIAIYETMQKRGTFPPIDGQIEMLKALEAQQEWVRVTDLFVRMTKQNPVISSEKLSQLTIGRYYLRSHSVPSAGAFSR